MHVIEFVANVLDQVSEEVQLSLTGMTVDQLLWRPAPEANPMAWIAWHIARTQDLRASHLTGRDQLWIADGWHARFGMAADPGDTGRGHNDEQVASVRPEAPGALSQYCAAAHRRAVEYIRSLSPGDEEQVISNPEGGETPLIAVLDRMAHGGATHSGQLMYVRGLVERRHWFSR